MKDSKMIRYAGRIAAGAYYDFQEIRKATMNRVRDLIRKKREGIPFDEVEPKKEDKRFSSEYADDELIYRLEDIRHLLTEKEYDYLKHTLLAAQEMKKLELVYKNMMQGYVETEVIYQRFLRHIKGVSAVLSANLIKEFGYCEKYKHSSSLWRACGLDVEDGEAPKRVRGKKTRYNPRLRTMAWKIADSFRKQRTPVYRDIYDAEKEEQIRRMENSRCKYCGKRTVDHYKKPNSREYYCTKEMKQQVTLKDFTIAGKNTAPGATPPWTPLHAELRAMRKAVKIFLEHYWVASRELTGQPTESPWIIEHGHHSDYIHWSEAVEKNIKAKEDKILKNKPKK